MTIIPTTTHPGNTRIARITRRPRLQSEIAANAFCPQPGQGFARTVNEPTASWRTRSAGLRRIYGTCPARPACLEVALRDHINHHTHRAQGADTVRAGHSPTELYEFAGADILDLEEAVARDDDPSHHPSVPDPGCDAHDPDGHQHSPAPDADVRRGPVVNR
ncbi:hypothetical protein [Streptomyces tsukubensis]|uniref:hypothetical protein n=1 Tax=Streptomyces tsukubensis TaxID=83656 RepID=UPI00344ED208